MVKVLSDSLRERWRGSGGYIFFCSPREKKGRYREKNTGFPDTSRALIFTKYPPDPLPRRDSPKKIRRFSEEKERLPEQRGGRGSDGYMRSCGGSGFRLMAGHRLPVFTNCTPIHLHGGKEPLPDHPHRALRYGLCPMLGLSPGKEPVRGCYAGDRLCTISCTLSACEHVKDRYRHGCGAFPCRKLKQLDNRYRTKYPMSMLENLAAIKKDGIRAFVKSGQDRWTCTACGGTIDIHHYH